VDVHRETALARLLVEETELTIFERWGAALDSVDFKVLTTSDTFRIKKLRNTHEGSYPSPL
jgi:hypothetical protein